MKAVLIVLLILGLVGGGVYYTNPELLGLDAPAKVSKKKTGKKKAKKGDKKSKKASAAADETSSQDDDDSSKEDEVVEPAPSVNPLNFLDNLDARAKAKAEGKPCLIIWHGSDWLPNTTKLAKQWMKLEQKQLPVVLGQINESTGVIPDLHQREKLLPIGAFMDLPVAVLLAPDETLLGIYKGKTVRSAAALEKAVNKTLKDMPRYMELVEKARSTDGVEGARAAGQALAMQPYDTAMRNKPIKDILNKKDKDHQTKLRFLYGMDHMGMYDEINAVLCGGKGADAKFKGNERQFDAGLEFVQSILKMPKLNDTLKQQWTSGLAYVYREKFKATKEPALRARMVKTYRDVVKIDPRSEYGKGARRWADYWDDSVPYEFEELYYDNGEMTVDVDKEWRVNVTSQMDGPGTYTFTITPLPSKNGRLTAKGFQLYADGNLVCDGNVPADQDARKVSFEVPRALKGKVEVRFRVQCFDGWYGCAGEMQMSKN